MSVVFSNNSQEEQLRKEELQIVRRKKIADERLERILNPRSKYGAETRDLDAQTAESRRRKEIEQQNREIDRKFDLLNGILLLLTYKNKLNMPILSI